MVTGSSTSRIPASQKWLCFWPGLVRLWFFGDFSALLFAVGFSILLNLALLSTFIWPQWLGNQFPIVAWPVLSVVWLGSWLISYRILKDANRSRTASDAGSDALFIAAQTEYLKGNWHEAVALAVRQLRFRPRDVETRMLLASIHLHSGNVDEAQKQIELLEKLDGSSRWRFELDQLHQKVRGVLEDRQSEDNTHEVDDSDEPDMNHEVDDSDEPDMNHDSANEMNETDDLRNEDQTHNQATSSEPGVTDSVFNSKAA